MAAITQTQYADWIQTCLKLANVLANRADNTATGKAGITSHEGGTGESATTLINTMQTYITALG